MIRLNGGVGLRRHAFGLLEHEAELPEQAGHGMHRVGHAKDSLDLRADGLGRLRHLVRHPRGQRRPLVRRQTRDTPSIGEALHASSPLIEGEPAMLAHRTLVKIEGHRDPMGRPAIIKQQQHVHPAMHGAVHLPTHQRQEMRPVLGGEKLPGHPPSNHPERILKSLKIGFLPCRGI